MNKSLNMTVKRKHHQQKMKPNDDRKAQPLKSKQSEVEETRIKIVYHQDILLHQAAWQPRQL